MLAYPQKTLDENFTRSVGVYLKYVTSEQRKKSEIQARWHIISSIIIIIYVNFHTDVLGGKLWKT